MDYITKATNRMQIRYFAILFRKAFGLNETEKVPVLHLLDLVPNVFPNCYYEIVDDSLMNSNIPARCFLEENNFYRIQIKASIYEGACKGVGAYSGHICHEICHVFLFYLGYVPIYERSFENKEVRPFESVEWQAKALCGEVMIPYNATKGYTAEQIRERYNVSIPSAKYRVNLDIGKTNLNTNKKTAFGTAMSKAVRR